MKLLFAEDDQAFADAILKILTYNSYLVDFVDNDKNIYEVISKGCYDGIILDLASLRSREHDLIFKLRQRNFTAPIMVLGDNSRNSDIVRILDSGADDYLEKPFCVGEFLARIRAMLRRRAAFHPDILTFGDLTLDKQSWTLICKNKQIVLTRREYRVMERLMECPSSFISAESLLLLAWSTDAVDVSKVWLYINYLRNRLKKLGSSVEIKSRRHVGYCLKYTALPETET